MIDSKYTVKPIYGHHRDPENVSGKEVSAKKRFSMRFLINLFPEKVSVIRRCPLYRMSAIERFYCTLFKSLVGIPRKITMCSDIAKVCFE